VKKNYKNAIHPRPKGRPLAPTDKKRPHSRRSLDFWLGHLRFSELVRKLYDVFTEEFLKGEIIKSIAQQGPQKSSQRGSCGHLDQKR